MILRSWDAYMTHAFPMDELDAIACKGIGPTLDRHDDVQGNYSLTLVDGLDTLAILGEKERFREGVQLVEKHVDFEGLTTRVSLFEVTIRMLGGLLSSHLFASDPTSLVHMEEYDGSLLRLATQLGDKLLPAFDTPTGIPYNIITLQDGPIVKHDGSCTAAAGSLLLEFGTLSRLTGNASYEVNMIPLFSFPQCLLIFQED